jgi:enoyl-CoA hydratase/carnithine racemase
MSTLPGLPDELLFEQDGAVATITLNRPEKLNTMTPAMGKAIIQLVTYINNEDSIRVVILTGTGSRAFSAGSDIKVLDDYGSNWQLRNRIDYARELWKIRKPVIAKIRGYCIGGGLEMALMSDIRYATPDSKFGAGEIKLGWHGGAGNTQLLPRVMSPGRALEMLLTGDIVSAAEAQDWGLVDRIFDDADIDAKVADLAARIAGNAPIASELAKHLVRVSMSTAVDVGLQYENDTFAYCFTTEDSDEGRAAFAEKRRPNFRGR